jgi:hypothetical protein
MRLPANSDAHGWLHARGMAVTNEETMSQAIHDVYCGIMADHDHPNEKDRTQARAMLGALRKHVLEGAP